MATFTAKPHEVVRKWYLVDAANRRLGRLATGIATRLRGKHKAIYTPHTDTGDFIIVVNADKVTLTGNKEKDKMYYKHSGYPGGMKSINAEDMRKKHPTRLVENAVKGMLPKGPLGRQMYRKLKVYAGSEHPHASQQPEKIET